MMRACVTGLGPVGLTLAVALANVGMKVAVVEADRATAATLYQREAAKWKATLPSWARHDGT